MLILNDYSQLIPATSAVLGFTGYMDSEAEKEKAKAVTAYERALRAFVYAGLKKMPDRAMFKNQVLGELAAMEREQGPCMGEFAVLRNALLREIDQQGGMGMVRRLVRRWWPWAGGALLFLLAKGFDILQFFDLLG